MKFVSVTHKMTGISLISCLVVLFFTFTILNSVIFTYINRIEANDVNDGLDGMETVLKREEANLERTVLDWAHWDDTYAFMAGENSSNYESNNLQDTTLRQLDLNFMLFINEQGRIVSGITRDLPQTPGAEDRSTISKQLLAKLDPTFAFTPEHDVRSGVINVQGRLFLVAVSPITTTDETAPGSGVLLIGRSIDDSLLDYMNSLLKAKVELTECPDAMAMPGQLVQKNQNYITAYRLLNDINGSPELLASFSMQRADYNLGKYYIRIFTIIFSLILLLMIIMEGVMVNRYILKRLTTIHEFIKRIAKDKDTSVRLRISGQDEVGHIADSINTMLAEMAASHQKSRKINERMQTILEATDDGYLEYNLKTKEYYISPRWSQFQAADKQRKGFDPFAEYMKRIHPESLAAAQEAFNSLIYGKQDYAEAEYKMINADGTLLWVLHKGKVMERDEKGQALRVVSILLNITARKEYEEKIVRLSYYDKLTGLRNRAYMEERFSELDCRQGIEYSITMGDVNGLKLVNDTFGHAEGDRLIQTIGQILQKMCAEADMIGRWGGDEFVILSLNKAENYLFSLMQAIQEECKKIDTFGFKISIALGSANSSEQPDFESVMRLAEERMYRSKLTAVKSVRNATITSLEHTLYEKNSETEEHTQRIKKQALQLGKQLHLSQDELNELELLSSLHDIGKIGIPEQILMKPGKLTAEEWKIMQRHAEIGYRIAKATPGLAHVAEEILCHHEKFDGTGYPQGLQGEEIPLLSRIINIVDSFDVMTHKRIYKRAATIDYAIGELKRCSGTQFDPVLVVEFLKLLAAETA